jgi:hypothetical protein
MTIAQRLRAVARIHAARTGKAPIRWRSMRVCHMTKRSSTDTPNAGEPSGDRQADLDRLIAEASPEPIADWKQLIEQGWQEAQAGQLVAGPEFMGRLLRRAMEETHEGGPRKPPPSPKRSRT